MNESEEAAYIEGKKAAWATILRTALRELGIQDPAAEQAAWVAERAEVVAALRTLCQDYGDNNWADDLNLADVIENHLIRHIIS